MLSVNCFRRFPAVCYPTVEDIRKALRKKALSGNSPLKKENTNSVLLDVSLQIRNSDNELAPVDPENFPQDGVEVLLPYPEGTDSSYTFVITHMITSGEHAGEIKVLNYQAEADGPFASPIRPGPPPPSPLLWGIPPLRAAVIQPPVPPAAKRCPFSFGAGHW